MSRRGNVCPHTHSATTSNCQMRRVGALLFHLGNHLIARARGFKMINSRFKRVSLFKDYHLYSSLFFQHHPGLFDNRALPLHYSKERLQVIHLPYIHS